MVFFSKLYIFGELFKIKASHQHKIKFPFAILLHIYERLRGKVGQIF